MTIRFCPPHRLLLGLLCGWLIGSVAGLAHAQSLPRLLQDIKVSEVSGRETVRFHFSETYQGIPAEEHGRGRMSVNFSGTGSSTPVRNFRVKDSKIFQDIRVVQNKYSTTVSFTLKDPNSSLKGRLAFTQDKSVLRMAVRSVAGAPTAMEAKPAAEENLLSQMSKTIAGAGTNLGQGGGEAGAPASAAEVPGQALGQYAGVEWMGTLVMMGISLAAIVGGLYLVLFIYRRFFGARISRLGGEYPIRLVSSFHIGPKQRVVVLDINGEKVACGVTASQISFLARLGGGAGQAQRRAAAVRPNRPAPAGEPRASGAPTAAAATQSKPVKADPVQQFAEALKEKVGSLKRIK
jgi:flagellar protein FliO/FliZ